MTDLTQDRLGQQIKNILDAEEAHETQDQANIAKLEARGWRIVGNRGDGDPDGAGDEGCEVFDWRTGETLIHVRGTDAERAAAVEAAEKRDGREWCLREDVTINATDGAYSDWDWLMEPELAPGVPKSLAEALIDWVEAAPVEEIADVTGLPPAHVRNQLRHLSGRGGSGAS